MITSFAFVDIVDIDQVLTVGSDWRFVALEIPLAATPCFALLYH
jgi:hypothetical protein